MRVYGDAPYSHGEAPIDTDYHLPFFTMRDFSQISYIVDSSDRLISLNQDWSSFAQNNGGEDLRPEAMSGRVLWDFIADEATRELYAAVLAKVRSGAPTYLVLRCDAPASRRLIEMAVHKLENGDVEFKTVLLAAKDRPFQRLFDHSTPRTTHHLMVCSWCDRVHVGGEEWVEVEEAMERLHLNDETELPQVDPMVCMACFTKVMEIVSGPGLQPDAP